MKIFKPAALCVALAALFAPLSTHALGLNGVSVKSALYEPLVADVSISVNPGEDVPSNSFVLASPARFAEAGLSYPAWMGDIRTRVERTGKKSGKLRLVSSKPIYEPVVHLLIEARMPKGTALIPVTLMLDTPFAKPLNGSLAAALPQPALDTRSPKHAATRAQIRASALAERKARSSGSADTSRETPSKETMRMPKEAPSRAAGRSASPARQAPASAKGLSVTQRLDSLETGQKELSRDVSALQTAQTAAIAKTPAPETVSGMQELAHKVNGTKPGVQLAPSTSPQRAEPAATVAAAAAPATTQPPAKAPATPDTGSLNSGGNAPLASAEPANPVAGVIAAPDSAASKPSEEPALSAPSAAVSAPAASSVFAQPAAKTPVPAPIKRAIPPEEPSSFSLENVGVLGATTGGIGLMLAAWLIVSALRKRKARRDEEFANSLNASTVDGYSPTEEALSAAPRAPAPAPFSLDALSHPAGLEQDPFPAPEAPSLKPVASEHAVFLDTVGSEDDLSSAISDTSFNARETEAIESLRDEVFAPSFSLESDFPPRGALNSHDIGSFEPLKTPEELAFESLKEQVAHPSAETLRPILSDPDSLRIPEADQSYDFALFETDSASLEQALEPAFSFNFDEPAPTQSPPILPEPDGAFVVPNLDAFDQAEALSRSAQQRSGAGVDLQRSFEVSSSLPDGESGRLQLELACLYAHNQDWESARSSIKEVLLDSELSSAHPEARRLLGLIP